MMEDYQALNISKHIPLKHTQEMAEGDYSINTGNYIRQELDKSEEEQNKTLSWK